MTRWTHNAAATADGAAAGSPGLHARLACPAIVTRIVDGDTVVADINLCVRGL